MPSKVRNGLLFFGILVVAGGVAWFSGIRREAPRAESAADGSLMQRQPSSFNNAPIPREPSEAETGAAEAPVAEAPIAGEPPNPSEAGGQARETARRVIAYYFHRTIRCPTCLSIEAQAQTALETGFVEELSAGRLEWHAINIEEPGNEHFEQEYQLDRQALVLMEVQDGQVQRYQKLERVWELVEDPAGFRDYVRAETSAFLGG
jgi:hypothetical protein